MIFFFSRVFILLLYLVQTYLLLKILLTSWRFHSDIHPSNSSEHPPIPSFLSMSIHPFHPIYLCASIQPSIYQFIYWTIHLFQPINLWVSIQSMSMHPSIHWFIWPSHLWASIHQFIYRTIHPIWPSTHQYEHPRSPLSIHWTIHPSIFSSIHLL